MIWSPVFLRAPCGGNTFAKIFPLTKIVISMTPAKSTPLGKDNLPDVLEIILCTYNRQKMLDRTLCSLFAPKSPLRQIPLTVLDNASTDGTSELISRYQERFAQIRHIRHDRNIGGNANIARAFEMATKKYLWILCDDDEYDWTYWYEIEQALLSDKYDCILTERKIDFTDKDLPQIINSLAFVPCGIYKTVHITDTVMSNIESNIMYSFPHLALGASLLNHQCKFYVPTHTVIKQNVNMEFTRGIKEEIHFRQAHVNLYSGYINSYQMIADKKLRKRCCDVLYLGKSFYYSMKGFVRSNDDFPYNLADVFWGITFFQKLQLIAAWLSCKVSTLLQYVFSISNSADRKYKVIIILGFKRKIKRR